MINMILCLYIQLGIDDAGHKYGAGSQEYAQAVIQNDKLLSTYIPQWIKDGV